MVVRWFETPSPSHGCKDETKEAPLCLGYMFSKVGFATGTRSESYQLQRQTSRFVCLLIAAALSQGSEFAILPL